MRSEESCVYILSTSFTKSVKSVVKYTFRHSMGWVKFCFEISLNHDLEYEAWVVLVFYKILELFRGKFFNVTSLWRKNKTQKMKLSPDFSTLRSSPGCWEADVPSLGETWLSSQAGVTEWSLCHTSGPNDKRRWHEIPHEHSGKHFANLVLISQITVCSNFPQSSSARNTQGSGGWGILSTGVV